MQENFRIAFIGAGNMSRALIGGMISSGIAPERVIASNPSAGKLVDLARDQGIQTSPDNAAAARFADVVVLAVKPQKMKAVCQALLAEAPEVGDRLFVSIAAGITCAQLRSYLGAGASIIRTMPNTPSLIGRGMTGLYAPSDITGDQRRAAEQIMRTVGEVLWVDDEAKINGVIAAAGSSPAYFFLVMEAMQASAEQMGFGAEEARRLVQQAALGAAELVCRQSDTAISELRRQVTSPGGATAEAIATLQQGNLAPLFDQAMRAAVRRSDEMAREFG